MPGFRSICWLSLVLAVLLAPVAARAAVQGYRYDTVHSQIVFSIDHDGYSRPFGRLHIARGWLRFDPDDWTRSATVLDIDMSSVDMGDAKWNAAVCGASLLDCARRRYAHFASTSVERTDATHGVLHGRLTLHGRTLPVDLPFTLNRVARTVFGMHVVAGFSATVTLDRTAFGITAFPHAIGHGVSAWLELEAIRDDRIDTSPGATP
jgi:polyisoprenoid-binding protein YceI